MLPERREDTGSKDKKDGIDIKWIKEKKTGNGIEEKDVRKENRDGIEEKKNQRK